MTRILRLSMAMVVAGGLIVVVAIEGPVQAETLTIGAAPSLKPVFNEILPMFEREYGATVRAVYGPSQTLRREIEQGAPIDVFLPSGGEELEKLQKKGLLLNGRHQIYAQTSLVLVMSATSLATPASFRDVLPNRTTRIAVGDPGTSALGEVTARALTKLIPTYKNHYHLVRSPHSEDIVNLLHRGEADMGIVYRIDAINSGQVRIIDENPAGVRVPIRFGLAVVSTCREASLGVAEEFFHFIMSPRIQKLLLKYGFDPVSLNESRMRVASVTHQR
jgi:molybdate transport system substrate-binding protein